MILDRFRLDNKAAIVTGAGRGIGAASALALAEAGADVVIAARSEAQLQVVADQIETLGRRCVVVAVDLDDLDNIAALANTCKQSLGSVDIVVNNLGGSAPRALLDTSPRFLEAAFHFNVATAHALVRASTPLMLEGGGGSFVNISSVIGRVAGRGYLAYGTAKAALAHYTRHASRDLAPRIRINAVAVGSVATSALDIVVNDENLRSQMEALTTLRRIGDPEDIAAAVVYLSSPAASYVTGKILEVDGGIDAPNLDLGIPDL